MPAKQSKTHHLLETVIFSCIYAPIAALLFGVASNIKSVKTSTDKELTVGEGDKEVKVSGGVQKVTVGVK